MAGKKISDLAELTDSLENADRFLVSEKRADGKWDSKSVSYSRLKTDVTREVSADITVIKGQLGLNDTDVIVYISPKAEYFINNGFTSHIDSNKRTYYTKDGADWRYGGGNFYPGHDNNLEFQYSNYGKGAGRAIQAQYPLFTLNAAMTFLRRFRSNSNIKYIVFVQFGDYDYGGSDGAMSVSHPDCMLGASAIYIDADMTAEQKSKLKCVTDSNCMMYPDGVGDGKYSDMDVVKARFIWNDANALPYTPYLNYMAFRQSLTYVYSCGFYMKRTRGANGYSQLTDKVLTNLEIYMEGGVVSFNSCVFRNVCVKAEPSSRAPQLFFASRPSGHSFSPSGESATADFDLAHIYKYFLPTVFSDDADTKIVDGTSTVGQVNRPLAVSYTTGNMMIVVSNWFVSRTARSGGLFNTYQSSLRFNGAYDGPFKLSWCPTSVMTAAVSISTAPVIGAQGSTFTYAWATYPSNAKLKSRAQTFAFEIQAPNGTAKPSWANNVSTLFRTGAGTSGAAIQSGYNYMTNTTDLIRYNILDSDSVRYNGASIPH